MLPSIETEIQNCRSLLNVCQAERRAVLSGEAADARAILPFLRLKRRLVGALDTRRRLDPSPAPTAGADEVDNAQHRQRLRELGALLEQLLVIDGENELLLRRALAGNATGAGNGRRPSGVENSIQPWTAPGGALATESVPARPAGTLTAPGTDPATSAGAAQRLKSRYL
jgi:flagellar biosynthesis/type III secretory pathway chaperone